MITKVALSIEGAFLAAAAASFVLREGSPYFGRDHAGNSLKQANGSTISARVVEHETHGTCVRLVEVSDPFSNPREKEILIPIESFDPLMVEVLAVTDGEQTPLFVETEPVEQDQAEQSGESADLEQPEQSEESGESGAIESFVTEPETTEETDDEFVDRLIAEGVESAAEPVTMEQLAQEPRDE